jgi:hypothetical protein
MYHAVSFKYNFYSLSNINATATEDASVLTWVPAGCTATGLNVYSQQSGAINVVLRQGTPGNMADTSLACSAATGETCTAAGNIPVAAGNFVDFSVSKASGTAAAVWVSVKCN